MGIERTVHIEMKTLHVVSHSEKTLDDTVSLQMIAGPYLV